MSLRDKLLKNSTVDLTDTLIHSKLFSSKDMIPTPVPIINVGLSGSIRGGIVPGTTMLAGPSKHFKSGFALLLAASFQRRYPDGVILFYDSEFGSPQSYFESFGINVENVVHTPVTSLEDLRHDLVNQLQGIERGEHVMVLIDSIGNLASKKETEDALEGKSAADFTRAKTIKSLFRLITPHLSLKNIPLIAINHTYMTMEMYSKPVVSGGCLIAGTMIEMADGTMKAIEEIEIAEQVMTMVGPRSVTATWTPETLEEGEPECYEITFEDGTSVVCSDEHMFLVNGEWKEAMNLDVGDDVKTM